MKKIFVLVAVVLLLGVGLQACGKKQPQDPKPLTLTQAEKLSVIRFNNYRDQRRQCKVLVNDNPSFSGDLIVDFKNGIGYGTYESDDQEGHIAWTNNFLSVTTADPKNLNDWYGRKIDSSFPVDVFLAILLQLHSDRPENPQLLQQSDARFLGMDGDSYIIAGPSSSSAASGKKDMNSRIKYTITKKGKLEAISTRLERSDTQFTASATCVPEIPPANKIPAVVKQVLQVEPLLPNKKAK